VCYITLNIKNSPFFPGHKYMDSTICLVYHEACLLRAVIGHLVLFCTLLNDRIFTILSKWYHTLPKPFWSPLGHYSFPSIAVQCQHVFWIPNVTKKFWIVEHVYGGLAIQYYPALWDPKLVSDRKYYILLCERKTFILIINLTFSFLVTITKVFSEIIVIITFFLLYCLLQSPMICLQIATIIVYSCLFFRVLSCSSSLSTWKFDPFYLTSSSNSLE